MSLSVQSTLEARVYQALINAGWQPAKIEVQADLFGGRGRKGGQVVDFVLWSPLPIPIRCQGEYWHPDPDQEIYEAQKIQAVYGVEPTDILGEEAKTQEETDQAILRKIGRPR